MKADNPLALSRAFPSIGARCVDIHDGPASYNEGQYEPGYTTANVSNRLPRTFVSTCGRSPYRLVRCDLEMYNELYVSRLAHMDTLTYSEARSKLANTMDKVCDDHAPIIITRKNSQSVVMMSLDDYQALEETAYLLRSPKNAKRLIESISELKSGGGTLRKLVK